MNRIVGDSNRPLFFAMCCCLLNSNQRSILPCLDTPLQRQVYRWKVMIFPKERGFGVTMILSHKKRARNCCDNRVFSRQIIWRSPMRAFFSFAHQVTTITDERKKSIQKSLPVVSCFFLNWGDPPLLLERRATVTVFEMTAINMK